MYVLTNDFFLPWGQIHKGLLVFKRCLVSIVQKQKAVVWNQCQGYIFNLGELSEPGALTCTLKKFLVMFSQELVHVKMYSATKNTIIIIFLVIRRVKERQKVCFQRADPIINILQTHFTSQKSLQEDRITVLPNQVLTTLQSESITQRTLTAYLSKENQTMEYWISHYNLPDITESPIQTPTPYKNIVAKLPWFQRSFANFGSILAFVAYFQTFCVMIKTTS